ncbi:GNAT family N-acetyltransferase [Bordetella sp. N]|uniref:GNAT family N-acetyltransferase n=1 Tax=Bordetella sp. N TaxID=1746199 RepID=UPI00070B5DDF|nr:GNAT family N-acetyltransferase [Bordetella sp. N]ALM84127.1 GCN5 family acetyltransferase [Bordetella sp. N]
MPPIQLRHLETDQDYAASFDVMRALRPHLVSAPAYAAQVRRQARQNYRVLAAWQDDQIVGLAGYRLQENLLYGPFLYVDDLVAADHARGQGVGAALIDALRQEARAHGCANLVLDTALSNALGQRFYFRQGLLSRGMHFSQPI